MSKINVVLSDLDVPNTGILTGGNLDHLKVVGITSLLLGLLAITFIILVVIKKHQHKYLTNHKGSFKLHKGIKTFFGLILLLGVLSLGLSTVNHRISTTEKAFADETQVSNALSIEVDDVTIEANLNSENQFLTAKNVVTITSPANGGYTFGVYANDKDLKLEDNEEYAIKGLESEAPTTLSSNTWGVTTTEPEDSEAKIWQAMPITKDNLLVLKESDETTTANNKIEIYYGVNVNDELIAGTYSNTINYVATSNTPLITVNDAYGLTGKQKQQGYYVMQDMNEEICNLVNVFGDEGEAQLIDIRDNKLYYVARLADENCWMTQNLDHDIDSSKTYTPTDTDLPVGATWTPSSSTHPTDERSWQRLLTEPESYDPGNDNNIEYYPVYQYIRSCRRGSCDESFLEQLDGDWNAYLESCGEYYNNCDEQLAPEPTPHYQIGNYYNWTAAIAMNDSNDYLEGKTVANQSICPAGWTLPRAGIGEDTYYNLLDQYGFTEEAYNPNNNKYIWGAPLYLITSAGYDGNGISYLGLWGNYWTAVTSDSNTIYSLDVTYNARINPAINTSTSRKSGYPIRCVARPVTNSLTFPSA